MGKENEKDKINGYTLSRQWFDFVFNTEEMVRPIHTALYFWICELNNRLQWKEVFGLPTDYSMKAINVRGYQHYKKALDDLIRWGFIQLVTKSYNQHTCNQVALVLKFKADDLLHTLSIEQGIKQGRHSKTIQTEQTIKEEPEKIPALPGSDFIDLVVKEFLKVFPDYIIVAKGKERGLAGQLLGLWKKQNPDLNSDQILKSLHDYFERCKNIPDPWHKNKMSLGHMVSQYNDIGNILKNSEEKIVYIDAITNDTR